MEGGRALADGVATDEQQGRGGPPHAARRAPHAGPPATSRRQHINTYRWLGLMAMAVMLSDFGLALMNRCWFDLALCTTMLWPTGNATTSSSTNATPPETLALKPNTCLVAGPSRAVS